MPDLSNDTTLATSVAKPFSSMAELWRAHLDLRYALSNSEKGAVEASRTASDIRAFTASAHATGAVLGNETDRKTAQGILDYWSTELLSLPGAAAEDFTPALLAPFDSSRTASTAGEPTQSEKMPEEDARELIRFVATARLWRDSGGQPGYLLNDEKSIAQAARFKHQDPDIFALVAASEAALRRRRIRLYLLAGIAVVVLAAIGLSWFIYDQHQRTQQAERRAAASIEAVVRISKVLSRQAENRAIPVASATELFKEAEQILTSIDQRPETIENRAGLLLEFSDVYLNAGDSRNALALAEQAEKLADQLVAQDPGKEAWQMLVYKSEFRIGDLVVLSDRKRTKEKYDRALQIAESLARNHPGSADRQKDVTFILNKEGDLDLMKGAWESAKKSWYQRALEIGEALRVVDPQNQAARKIVGDAWARLAGLSAAQGHFDDALNEYQEALNTRKSLVQEHSEVDAYQGNLAATYDFIGDVYKDYFSKNKNRSDLLDKALQQYGDALKIRLARANEDPSNASRQDSLQHEYVAIGDVLLEQQDVEGAMAKYRTALGIREVLANKDPDNVNWKANLASAHDKLATALFRDLQFDAALKEYDAALEVRKDLAARFLDNRSRQSQLATAYERKGELLEARGKSQNSQSDLRDALDAYQGGLAVIDAFMRKDPNSGLQPVRDRLRKKIEGLASNVQ